MDLSRAPGRSTLQVGNYVKNSTSERKPIHLLGNFNSETQLALQLFDKSESAVRPRREHCKDNKTADRFNQACINFPLELTGTSW